MLGHKTRSPAPVWAGIALIGLALCACGCSPPSDGQQKTNVSITITDDTGAPMAGAYAYWRANRSQPTDNSGQTILAVTAAPGSEARIPCFKPGYKVGYATVIIPAAAGGNTVLSVNGAAQLTNARLKLNITAVQVLRDKTERPAKDLAVNVAGQPAGTTKADGTVDPFFVTSLDAASVRVTANTIPPSGESAAVNVPFVAGKDEYDVRLEITAAPLRKLAVVIDDPAGETQKGTLTVAFNNESYDMAVPGSQDIPFRAHEGDVLTVAITGNVNCWKELRESVTVTATRDLYTIKRSLGQMARYEIDVTDTDQTALARVNVQIDGVSVGETDANGQLRTDQCLPALTPNSRTVLLTRTSYARTTQKLKNEDGVWRGRFTMDKAKESVAGPITVAVIRRGGQPAMNAKVTIQGPDGQTVPGIKIDSEGRIVLPNSIPGEYLLKAYVDGAPKDVTQTINPRSLTQPIIIDFPGGQEQISIRAIDSYKNPVPGATVTLTAVKQGKKIVDRQPLPLTGQAMELGDYTVQIEAENYISYGKHITISHEPATRDLTFELREDFLAQARRAYAAGDYQQALDLAANVPAVEQLEYIEAQILSGRCCARLQQFDEAVMFDRRALALNKKNPEVYFNLGLALFNLWNYGEAYDAFRGTVEQIRYVKDSANAGKLEADAYVYMAICKARLWEAMGKSEKDCPGCQAEAIRNLELFDQMAEQSPVLRHDENMQKHYNDARRIVAEKPGA